MFSLLSALKSRFLGLQPNEFAGVARLHKMSKLMHPVTKFIVTKVMYPREPFRKEASLLVAIHEVLPVPCRFRGLVGLELSTQAFIGRLKSIRFSWCRV